MPKGKSKKKFKIYDVMPGSKIVTYKEYNILLGSPLEVVKAIIRNKFPIPTHVVLPDSNYVGTIVQNATEFPLYYFLFGYQGLAKNLQFTIIGTEEQVSSNRELLRLAFLGLTREEYKNCNVNPEWIETLLKEADFYALKEDNDNSLPLEKLIYTRTFDNKGVVELNNGLKLRKTAYNIFELDNANETISIDINISYPQNPPYSVSKVLTSYDMEEFGVEILGGSSGFSPINPCSGMLIAYKGSYLLIDPIPYLDYLLKAKGVSKNQIKACFITHVHDDHCVLLPFLFYNRKMDIITTPEIYYMSIYKLALTLNIKDYKKMEKYFNFIPIKVDKEFDFYGMKILAHYTLHPVTTIGAKFTVIKNKKAHTFTYIGDNQSLSIIDGMYEKGIINSERKRRIKDLYTEKVDLLIADGGHGMIHGDPADGLDSKAKKIAFIHLDELPEEYKTLFNLASNSKTFSIIKSNTTNRTCTIIEYLNKNFPDIEDKWTPYIINYENIIKYNAGDVIIKEGYEANPSAYIILTGYCKVIVWKDKKIDHTTILEAGELLGEIAIIKADEYRTASVIAETPVSLCEFNLEAFKSFSIKNELLLKLNSVWSLRKKFSKIEPFCKYSNIIVTNIAHISKEVIFGTEHKMLIDKNIDEVFIIIDGSGIIKKDGVTVNLKAGDIFGNIFFLIEKEFKYEIYVSSYMHCVVIKTKNFIKFINSTPIFNYYISTKTLEFFEKLMLISK